MIAKVILNNRQHNIDQCFDYEIPAQMEVSVGCRVEVLFGRGNFFARGIVVEITKSSYFKNLKEIRKVLDKEPFVSESILNLCLWVKEKYFCSFYQALRLFLPPGLESGAREKTARYANLKISEDEALSLAEDMLSKRAKVQGQMLKALCEIHPIKVTELYTLSGGNASTLSSLAKKGLVEIFSERVYREAYNKNKYKPSENYVQPLSRKRLLTI